MHVTAANVQVVNLIRYSECPLLALMHALNHLMKLRMDLSMDYAASYPR